MSLPVVERCLDILARHELCRNLVVTGGEYEAYMTKLVAAFNAQAATGVMCRSAVSVGYDGRLYDCDFNQMLDMQLSAPETVTVFNFDLDRLLNRRIRFAWHCFGCTAGPGAN